MPAHKPCSLETAKKQNHREGEINITCIRGYYSTTRVHYDPGNIAKNSHGKEAFLCSVAHFQTYVPVSETVSISHIFLYLKKKWIQTDIVYQ